MASFNKVILIGNLTRDPELKFLPNGTAVAKIGLAVNRVWTNDAGEKKEEVTFVDIDLWGKTAENTAQYVTKGRQIMVEGRLKLETWEDKTTNEKKSKMKVVGESVLFLGAPKEGGEPKTERGTTRRTTAEPEPATTDDDEIPF